MAIQTFQFTATQSAVFSATNSGYASTTAGPTANQFSVGSNSGNFLLHQFTIASGATQKVDLASGGNLDLVGQTINFVNVYSLYIQPFSGSIQVETSQSGGMLIPQLGLSGGGILIDPAGVACYGEQSSGYQLGVTATKGNLVLHSVSGGPLLCNVGIYGV